MSLQRNHYEVLGVPQNATTDQIKKKYRELARKFHPDVAKDKDTSQKVFSQINQAYHALADPERRSKYDATLNAPTAVGVAANGTGNGFRPSGGAPAPSPTPAARDFSAPSGADTADVTRLLAEADRAVMQGKMADARLICEKIVKLDSRNAKAWDILGDALLHMGYRTEAANAYRSSLQISPSMMVQAKLNRLTAAPAPNGAAPAAGNGLNGGPVRSTSAPSNGVKTNLGNGAGRTPQPGTEAKAGGFLGRFLGRK